MRIYPRKRAAKKLLTAKQDKWIRALNTLVSNTQIRPDELADAQDVQIIEDGKVQCPRDGQDYFGNSSGSRVTGIFPFYKSDGTKQLLRIEGTHLQKYNSSTHDWDNVSGYTYTTTLNMEGVMAYDRLYLVNGTDPITYYDGTSITSFTAISAPGAPTVTRTGTTGSFTFSYKITAVTAVGETDPSSAGTANLNQGTLDTSNYMSLSWSAVTSAIGYNVYGRKDGEWYFMKYLEGNSSTAYVDKNTDTPSEAFTPPEANSTGGVKGKYIALYKDSLFILGDPDNPSRLQYSGGGDKIHDFTVNSGGGFIDVSKNDGQKGTQVKPFKNTLVTFKERSIYQFSFTSTGLPQIVQITDAVGCIAPRSVVAVENDIFFASERGIFSIGNEAGFSFDVLRTNELSARVRSIYQSIDPSYIQNISAIYATKNNVNYVLFSYTPSGSTTNSKALVYDRERLGWIPWTNINANCWATYVDSTGEVHVLYGDDSSGYVKEILSGDDDFGSAIRGSFKLKADSFQTGLDEYKKLRDVSVVLRQPTGSVNLSVIVDGSETAFAANIATISPSINWGHYVFSRFLLGVSYGTGAATSNDDIVLRTKRNLNLDGKAFQLGFTNGSSGASFVLLQTSMTAKPRSSRYRESEDLIT